jgi:hypothetical protein
MKISNEARDRAAKWFWRKEGEEIHKLFVAKSLTWSILCELVWMAYESGYRSGRRSKFAEGLTTTHAKR